jgi:hypothetical protein
MPKAGTHYSFEKNPRMRFLRKMFPQVKSIHDANQSIQVEVTKKDCEKASKMEPDDCAMVHAAKRQFKADGVVVGVGASYIIKGTKAIRFKTSTTVAREITSFDRHNDFRPGIYTMSKIPPQQRFGNTSSHERKVGKPKEHKHQTLGIRSLYAGTAAPKKRSEKRK